MMIGPVTGDHINRRVILQAEAGSRAEEGTLVGTTDDPDFVNVRFVYRIDPYPDDMVKVVKVKRDHLRWVGVSP